MPFCQPRLSEVRPYSSELSPEDPSLNIKIDGKQMLRYDLTNSQCVYEGSVLLHTTPPFWKLSRHIVFVPRLPYEESSRVGWGEGRGYEEDGRFSPSPRPILKMSLLYKDRSPSNLMGS